MGGTGEAMQAARPVVRRGWLGAFVAAFLAAALALLAGCAGLPPRGPVPASSAYTDTDGTALARLAVASKPADEAAPSGFRLLPTGEFAFNARAALMQRAERSLDLQYYHIHRDEAGRALLRGLRDAAARGVRVRLLVDDFHVVEIQDLLLELQAHDGIEVRLFNPVALRGGAPVLRLLLSPGDFELHNHRMHNKLFVADNAVAIYGGRNVADEYFMSHREANFIDIDVLSTGAVVRDLSEAFDRYWNSDAAWPVERVLGALTDRAAARERFDAAVRQAAPLVPSYRTDPLGATSVESQIEAGRLQLAWARATVHADPPGKATDPERPNAATAAMAGLLQAIGTARSEVAIASPYFIPSDVGMGMMREAARQGVRAVIFTNSLASTDEPLAHDAYGRYRAEMLHLGVELFEFNPEATRRTLEFGRFGSSTPRLHAKVAIVDRRRVLVGSVNLDGRSAVANTELGVVIDSPALAADMVRLIGVDGRSSLYRLRLAGDGRTIQWWSRDADGRDTVTTDEPGATPWLRLKLWLLSHFVPERLL